MKLNLYEDKKNTDERVDIYYSNMRPVIKQLIDTVNSERPSLRGRPADEDEDDGEEILLDPKANWQRIWWVRPVCSRMRTRLMSCAKPILR